MAKKKTATHSYSEEEIKFLSHWTGPVVDLQSAFEKKFGTELTIGQLRNKLYVLRKAKR